MPCWLMQSTILLTTANARFSHSSFGLRCILANLQELEEQTSLLEFVLSDSPEMIVERWLQYQPKIIGVGIYIWNIEILTKAIQLLKSTHPQITIVIGGPEVSFGVAAELMNNVDYIVQLEGEEVFRDLSRKILKGESPKTKVIKADVIDVTTLKLPYYLYSDGDIKNRKIYVEASRGCAFKCHFCLSSLDNGIRNFNVDYFLRELELLYQRGARQFKFVDRTFNLDIKLSSQILNFFLDNYPDQNFFLHFEIIPDRLPSELKTSIEKFKPGVLQFEVGIQTLDKLASERIGRRQNKTKALENLSYLRHHTNAHLHVDLIIGLPGVTLDIFKDDLNELLSLELQEVQLGILKNLKGTPLAQHILPYDMVFEKVPPYEIQSNRDLPPAMMKQLRAFHKNWDKYFNSGNFIHSMSFLFKFSNPYDEFFALSNYTYAKFQRSFAISLDQLSETLLTYLQEEKEVEYTKARDLILRDILKKKGRKVPTFLKNDKLGLPQFIVEESSSQGLERQSNFSL